MKASDLTVVIPAHNAAGTIATTLASLHGQQAGPPRVIVSDDGSTDATAEVVKQAGPSARLIGGARMGPGAARNRGIRLVDTPLVAFCDADDRWPPARLGEDLALFTARPELDVILGRTRFDPDRPELLAGRRFAGLDRTALIPSFGAATMRRTVFEQTGWIDESIHHFEDYDFFLRIREAGLTLLTLQRTSQWTRVHTGSTSHQDPAKPGDFLRMIQGSLKRRRHSSLGPLPRLVDLLEQPG